MLQNSNKLKARNPLSKIIVFCQTPNEHLFHSVLIHFSDLHKLSSKWTVTSLRCLLIELCFRTPSFKRDEKADTYLKIILGGKVEDTRLQIVKAIFSRSPVIFSSLLDCLEMIQVICSVSINGAMVSLTSSKELPNEMFFRWRSTNERVLEANHKTSVIHTSRFPLILGKAHTIPRFDVQTAISRREHAIEGLAES